MRGLIGAKLNYSFSKLIHEELYDVDYNLIELDKKQFNEFMDNRDFESINVTIPYKQDVIPYLYEIDEGAKRIGAVNTIVNTDGKLYGYNTDYAGFKYLLENNGIEIKNKDCLILGTGGTSKTVRVVLEDLEAKTITSVSRRKQENAITYNELDLSDYQVIINTTPVGMNPNLDSSPIDLTLNSKNIQAVVDVIYNPLKTKLVTDAEGLNIQAINGLEMLVYQAYAAAELFLDKKLVVKEVSRITKMLLALQTNIVLIGMSTCGKSTIGEVLAKKMNRKFIDIDSLIIEKAKMSIADIFSKYGEDYFRELETKCTYECAHNTNAIIATGGGVIKNVQNINYLSQNGLLVFIDRPLEDLVLASDRPLLTDQEVLKELYYERIDLYHAYADIVVPNNKQIDEVISDVEGEFNEYFSN